MRKRYHAPATPCDRLIANPRRAPRFAAELRLCAPISIRFAYWRDPGGPNEVGGTRGLPHDQRGCGIGDAASDRGLPGKATHGLAGWRSAANGAADIEGQARPSPACFTPLRGRSRHPPVSAGQHRPSIAPPSSVSSPASNPLLRSSPYEKSPTVAPRAGSVVPPRNPSASHKQLANKRQARPIDCNERSSS